MAKINPLSEDQRRKVVYDFYLSHMDQGKAFTVAHFKSHGISQSTIYDIIRRAENDSNVERKVGSGPVTKKMPQKAKNKLKKMFDNKRGVSTRKAASNFNISQTYVRKILNKASVVCRRRITIPARTEAEKLAARPKCRNLYVKY